MNEQHVRIATISLETTANAAAETVWDCLINDIDAWWGEPYVNSYERQALTLDARPGGLLFEDWGNGNGTTWASVRALRRPQQLDFDGTFMMTGALHGRVSILIEGSEKGGTKIALTQHAIGAITDETTQQWQTGWTELLESLAQHSEQQKSQT